jgi:integrase
LDFLKLYENLYDSMGSLHRDPRGRSPYWYASYRLADGRWAFKSTKQKEKKQAEQKLRAFEDIEEAARRGEATRDHLIAIVNQTLRRMGYREVERITVGAWLDRWIETEKGAVADSTIERYRQIVRDFKESLGARVKVRLEAITTEDITKFRDELLAKGLSPYTVNLNVRKILKRPFKLAIDEGWIQRNPVAVVRQIRGTTAEKGVFTPQQVALLLETAEGDWKGMILAGYYTGARLSDLARLRWSNVNLNEKDKTITFWQKKTEGKSPKAKVKIPIHPELEEYLISGPLSDNPNAPVFPQLHQKPGSGKSGLSMAFKRIMQRAGIDGGIIRERRGAAGRSVSALSFHSLRHSFNSALANAGVSQELRQKLTGHASEAMNTLYTHHELQTIRNAVASISRLPKGNAND